jgi:hypothetical protein
MAKITVQDLNSIIQDLSEHELGLQGGLCGVLRKIRIGNLMFIIGDKCRSVSPKDLLF